MRPNENLKYTFINYIEYYSMIQYNFSFSNIRKLIKQLIEENKIFFVLTQ